MGKTATSRSGRLRPRAPPPLTPLLACASARRRAILRRGDVGGGLGPLVPLRGRPAPRPEHAPCPSIQSPLGSWAESGGRRPGRPAHGGPGGASREGEGAVAPGVAARRPRASPGAVPGADHHSRPMSRVRFAPACAAPSCRLPLAFVRGLADPAVGFVRGLAQTAIGFVSHAALRRHSWLILSKPPSGSFRAAAIGFVSPDGPPGAGGFVRGNRPALADHASRPTTHGPLTTPELPPALGPARHPAGSPPGRPAGARFHHHHRPGSPDRPGEPTPLDDERTPHAEPCCPP